jgi:TPR repeat protein
VPQDDDQAATWYLKAAEEGDADAQFRLGYAYRLGRGVPQDDAQAAVWYLKAADQGDADTQVHLGAMYYLGQGVPKDYVEAHKWRNLAASRASAERQKEYAEDSDAVAKAMTPAQIAEAQKLAREWVAAFEQRGGK